MLEEASVSKSVLSILVQYSYSIALDMDTISHHKLIANVIFQTNYNLLVHFDMLF